MVARFLIAFAVICIASRFAVGVATANEIRLGGITFASASDNMRLIGASGSGTLQDPFIVREEVIQEGDVVLQIRIDDPDFGSRVATLHAVGFALRKQVVNNTERTWDYFSMELEFKSGQGSDYYDGLSFGQSTAVNRPFSSNAFRHVEDMAEPRDMVRFSGGKVVPGQLAEFQIAITHTGPIPKFFLVQHLRHPFASYQSDIKLAARAPRHDAGWDMP